MNQDQHADTVRPNWRDIAEQLASALADCTVPGPKVAEARWAALEAYRAAQYDGEA